MAAKLRGGRQCWEFGKSVVMKMICTAVKKVMEILFKKAVAKSVERKTL